MTLRELSTKYLNCLDCEIVVSNDFMLLESKPIKGTAFGVDNTGGKILKIEGLNGFKIEFMLGDKI